VSDPVRGAGEAWFVTARKLVLALRAHGRYHRLAAILLDHRALLSEHLVDEDAAFTEDQIYRLLFDGSVADERRYVVMGGSAEPISAALDTQWRDSMSLAECVRLAVSLLNEFGDEEARDLTASQLEVAVLDRTRPRRAFSRLTSDSLTSLLGDAGVATLE
jgi:proteasome alpha subunit